MKRGLGYTGIYIFILFGVMIFFGVIITILYFSVSHCSGLIGDVNGDGKLDNFDVKGIRDYSEGMEVECSENADFNGDGEINTLDGRELTSHLLDRGRYQGENTDGGILSPDSRTELGKRPSDVVSRLPKGDEIRDESCASYIGDLNGDGVINKEDFDAILDLLTKRGGVKCEFNADVNNDGRINIDDKNALKEYLFGEVDKGKKGDLCIDTDLGANFAVKGVVIGYKDKETFKNDDKCIQDNLLAEYYCVGSDIKEKRQLCEGICEEGVCKDSEGQVQMPENACIDIDGGSNSEEKGEVTSVKDGIFSNFADYCQGNNLVEYICNDKDSFGENKICANGCVDGECIDNLISCANNPPGNDEGLSCGRGIRCDHNDECGDNLYCLNGKCEFLSVSPEEDFCTDSDQGKSTSVSGSVSGVKNGESYSRVDSCKSEFVLREFSCNGDVLVEDEINCEYGTQCVSGACVQQNKVASSTPSCSINPAGTCEVLSCQEGQACQCNAECSSGLTCVGNTCQPQVSCTNNPAGCFEELSCSAGQGCSCNQECGAGLQCNNNVCVSASCTSNSQCAVGLQCISGQCQYQTATCETNYLGCQAVLSCSAGNKCDCYAECSSGYCWGNSATSYTCQNICAFVGSYVQSPLSCCTKTAENGRCVAAPECTSNDGCLIGNRCVSGKCERIDNTIPGNEEPDLSCSNNPSGCDDSLTCDQGNKCDCTSECTTGYCWSYTSGDLACQPTCGPEGTYMAEGELGCCPGLSVVNGKCSKVEGQYPTQNSDSLQSQPV
ncbi:MAG: dockerin type I repeat-containing protein [Nanoarchaeota archaeon]|nr:dockerin type I repeat-containing protein [Nanoarchaeota archaeon]